MHPLDGPRAKVKRANGQLDLMQDTLKSFFEEHTYTAAIAEFDRKAGCHNLRINRCPPDFPDEWGVIIGEIAHNLRSALDLLIWQLAPNPNGRTAFPIFTEGRTKKYRRGRRNRKVLIPHFWGNERADGLYLLDGIKGSHLTQIERFQPYKRGNLGRQSPLFLLHRLNNTDKHRLITVLAPLVLGIHFTGFVGGGSKFKTGVPLYMNAKVGCVRPLPEEGALTWDMAANRIIRQHDVKVDIGIVPQIRFGSSCNAVKGLPVVFTLKRISDNVSSIIESFAIDL